MPNVNDHKPGSFCWVELGTSDQQAAKHFYGQLFGWSAVDMPMGPDEFYTMFKLNGRDVAAAYKLRPGQVQMKVPPIGCSTLRLQRPTMRRSMPPS